MVSGRALRRHFAALGIPAQKVVRKKESGAYVADFFIPEMDDPIASSVVWARRIQSTFPTAHIISTHDTIASWRPGNPVIYATVVFFLPEDSNAA